MPTRSCTWIVLRLCPDGIQHVVHRLKGQFGFKFIHYHTHQTICVIGDSILYIDGEVTLIITIIVLSCALYS